jgi:DtxR family Mn-dependent transcriptional regulator
MVKEVEGTATHQTASMEDYLKAIVLLSREEERATVTSISKLLGVKKPSVTSALVKLSGKGLVVHKRYGSIELTPEGLKAAQDVYHRHRMLRYLLAEILKVDPKIAEDDACRMEHTLSPSSLERLDQFINFTQNCPQGTPDCLEGFNYYLKHGRRSKEIMFRCQGTERVKAAPPAPVRKQKERR